MSFNQDDFGQGFYSNEAYSTPQGPFVMDNPFVKSENSILTKVFWLMTMGLGISAIAAMGGYYLFPDLISRIYLVLVIVELILVFALSLGLKKMSPITAKICFFAYAIVNGLTLSSLFYYYTQGSIYSTFFIAGAVFGAAAIYGKVTKKNLNSMGTYLLMGLVGIIIASIVNIFIQNSWLNFGITIIGLIVFIGLTAYDVYRVKNVSDSLEYQETDSIEKISTYFALQLYLDFINIFLKLLQFTGKRRN